MDCDTLEVKTEYILRRRMVCFEAVLRSFYLRLKSFHGKNETGFRGFHRVSGGFKGFQGVSRGFQGVSKKVSLFAVKKFENRGFIFAVFDH